MEESSQRYQSDQVFAFKDEEPVESAHAFFGGGGYAEENNIDSYPEESWFPNVGYVNESLADPNFYQDCGAINKDSTKIIFPRNNPEIEKIYDDYTDSVRYKGMSRLPSKNKTRFQILLDNIDANSLDEETFEKISRLLLQVYSAKTTRKHQLFSADDNDIIDAWNDNSRRFFESVFAKKILDRNLPLSVIDKLNRLINDMTQFLSREFQNEYPKFYSQWEDKKNDKEVYYLNYGEKAYHFHFKRRSVLLSLIAEKHFSTIPDELIVNLCDFHYLVHNVDHLKSYQARHPAGMMPYQTTEPLYNWKFRGRMSHLHSKKQSSLNLGIFRSTDSTPLDLRRPYLVEGGPTRPADQRYIDHPKYTRESARNNHQIFFSNPYNSMYVLGVSGSIILELRAVLFFISALKDGYYLPEYIQLEECLENEIELLKHYFLHLIGMFIYLEGGHALTEILVPLEIRNTQATLQNLLASDSVNISVKSLIFDRPEIMQLMKEALLETIQFNATLSAKKETCHQIRSIVLPRCQP